MGWREGSVGTQTGKCKRLWTKYLKIFNLKRTIPREFCWRFATIMVKNYNKCSIVISSLHAYLIHNWNNHVGVQLLLSNLNCF